jgi:hypothetical protein
MQRQTDSGAPIVLGLTGMAKALEEQQRQSDLAAPDFNAGQLHTLAPRHRERFTRSPGLRQSDPGSRAQPLAADHVPPRNWYTSMLARDAINCRGEFTAPRTTGERRKVEKHAGST